MAIEDVRFHGEGGRTFARVRVRFGNRVVDVPTELRTRIQLIVDVVGAEIAARQLHVTRESLAEVAGGIPVSPTVVQNVEQRIHDAERFTQAFCVNMDELMNTISGIERSLSVVDAIERFREVASRLRYDATRFNAFNALFDSNASATKNPAMVEGALRELLGSIDVLTSAAQEERNAEAIRNNYQDALAHAHKVLG
jgi:hypothetical protein